MVVWVSVLDAAELGLLAEVQASGELPAPPQPGLVLAHVSVSEVQRVRIGMMMARSQQALADGKVLEKVYRKAAKAAAQAVAHG